MDADQIAAGVTSIAEIVATRASYISNIRVTGVNGAVIPDVTISGPGGFAYPVNLPELAGDYNENGVVDAADYVIWRDTLGSDSDLIADGNGNDLIDAGDYDVWRTHFGQTIGSGSATESASVPEPSTLLLIGISAITLLGYRKAKSHG